MKTANHCTGTAANCQRTAKVDVVTLLYWQMSQAGAPRCAVCGEEFASKNKLFSHLKGSGECARVTGRASLRGNAPGTAVGAQCPARAHVQGMEARG